MRRLFQHLPLIMLVISLIGVTWAYGFAARHYRIFPYRIIADGLKTGTTMIDAYTRPDTGGFQSFSEVSLAELRTRRIVPVAPEGASAPHLQDPVLFYGGRFAFMDLCPSPGCLAVLYQRDGSVRHAYPFRPDAILPAITTPEFAYEETGFVFQRDARPVGIERYQDGDLLVVFHNSNTFPFGGGVARIAPDGRARWFRRDYSHHWAKLLADGRALVPGLRLRDPAIRVRLHPDADAAIEIDCRDAQMLDDLVRIVDGNGALARQFSVLDSLLASPFRAVIEQTTDPCDPLHLNHIDVVGDDLADPSGGVRPGDFIVSLRNISSIGVIDADSGRFKRLLRGTFLQQHSVSYWRDGQVLMFDNHGGSWQGGPSRLVAVDLLSGIERTLFPTEHTEEEFRSLFSDMSGKVDIAADGLRAIVTFTDAGKALEVRLSDGAVLTAFESLHDLSAIADLPEQRTRKAAHSRLYGVDYASEAEERG